MEDTSSTRADQLLRRPEVARRLHTTERHIERLARSGALPYVKVGRLVRFQADDVEDFIAAHRTPSRPVDGKDKQ